MEQGSKRGGREEMKAEEGDREGRNKEERERRKEGGIGRKKRWRKEGGLETLNFMFSR